MVHYFACDPNTAVADTKQGKVRGYVYDGITIFKGIPYAKAKRFHAPEAIEPWEGVLETVNYGYVDSCLRRGKASGPGVAAWRRLRVRLRDRAYCI